MDHLYRIASWLGESEATISAVVGITVLAGMFFAGVRSLVQRSGEIAREKTLVASAEAPATTDSSTPLPRFPHLPRLRGFPDRCRRSNWRDTY